MTEPNANQIIQEFIDEYMNIRKKIYKLLPDGLLNMQRPADGMSRFIHFYDHAYHSGAVATGTSFSDIPMFNVKHDATSQIYKVLSRNYSGNGRNKPYKLSEGILKLDFNPALPNLNDTKKFTLKNAFYNAMRSMDTAKGALIIIQMYRENDEAMARIELNRRTQDFNKIEEEYLKACRDKENAEKSLNKFKD